MTVVTFSDYKPPPRYDSLPWVGVRIREAADPAGPWVAIEDIAFINPDADPAAPALRSFTTELATLASGWYTIAFYDESGDETPPSARSMILRPWSTFSGPRKISSASACQASFVPSWVRLPFTTNGRRA